MSSTRHDNVVTLRAARAIPPPSRWPERKKRLFRAITGAFALDYFKASDRPVLIAYCEALDLHELASAQLDAEGAVLTDRTGRKYANPAAAIVSQAAARIASLGGKLRIHPASRMRSSDAYVAAKRAPSAIRPPWEYRDRDEEAEEAAQAERYFDGPPVKPRPVPKKPST
ncbi:phage terminase small subunit P27 family, partial [Paraburkholderia sp. BR14261]